MKGHFVFKTPDIATTPTYSIPPPIPSVPILIPCTFPLIRSLPFLSPHPYLLPQFLFPPLHTYILL